jgi:hypothetical protein
MKYSLVLLLAFVCSSLHAQTGDTTAVQEKKVTFTAGALYNSSLNYYGRTDSLKSQGWVPFAGITLKNGLYLFSNFIFINNALTTSYAATTVEAGYKFKNQKGSLAGNIYGIGYFYKEDVSLVQSVVKQQAGINLSGLNKVINIHAGVDAKFSDQTDFGLYASVDHRFRIEPVGKGVIVIAPAAYSYFGTQRFSKTYLEQKRFLLFPVGQEQITQTSSAFNALSYEFSFAFVYGIGKMNLAITPSYVLPQNVFAADGSPQKTDNLFYTTATIRFDF